MSARSLEVRPVRTDTVVIVDERDTSGGQLTIFNHAELHADFLDCHNNILLFVGCCLATKVFIGKLPATRGVWVILG